MIKPASSVSYGGRSLWPDWPPAMMMVMSGVHWHVLGLDPCSFPAPLFLWLLFNLQGSLSFLENLPGQPQPIASFPLYWLIWLPSNLPIIFKYYLFRIHNELRNFSSGNWPHRKATPVITRAPVTCQAPSRVRIISILWLRKQKLGETGTQRTIWSLSEHSIGRLIICGVRTFLRRSLSWNLI